MSFSKIIAICIEINILLYYIPDNKMPEKDKIISKIYHEFYGSINNTYLDARKEDKTITYDDVKKWFDKSFVRKTNLKGYNSYVAHHAFEEFQMDLFFINDLEDQEYKIGLLIVDIFSKYLTVVPLDTKQISDVLQGIKTGFANMGGKPEVVYSDDEGALNSKEIQSYFNQNDIKHIVSRGHAPVAERSIRTIKDLMYRQIDSTSETQWTKVLPKALTIYNYKMKHRTTKFTPAEARQNNNQLDVKLNMELHRVKQRVYPDINVGDNVRIYKKKYKFDKERVPIWTKTTHVVEILEEYNNQNFYYITGFPKPLLRNEILKVS